VVEVVVVVVVVELGLPPHPAVNILAARNSGTRHHLDFWCDAKYIKAFLRAHIDPARKI
jgi:hypothetical protein